MSSLPALPVMHDGRGLKVVAGTEGEAWEGEDSEAEDNKDNTGVLLEGHCAGESGGEGGPAGDNEGGGAGDGAGKRGISAGKRNQKRVLKRHTEGCLETGCWRVTTCPKKPVNAYMMWYLENRRDIQAQNAGMAAGKLSQVAGQLWKAMPDSVKERYRHRTALALDTYYRDLAAYKAYCAAEGKRPKFSLGGEGKEPAMVEDACGAGHKRKKDGQPGGGGHVPPRKKRGTGGKHPPVAPWFAIVVENAGGADDSGAAGAPDAGQDGGTFQLLEVSSGVHSDGSCKAREWLVHDVVDGGGGDKVLVFAAASRHPQMMALPAVGWVPVEVSQSMGKPSVQGVLGVGAAEDGAEEQGVFVSVLQESKYVQEARAILAGTLEPEPYPAQAAPTPRELGTWRVPRSAAEFLARVEAYLLPREPGLFGQFMDALAGFRRAIDGGTARHEARSSAVATVCGLFSEGPYARLAAGITGFLRPEPMGPMDVRAGADAGEGLAGLTQESRSMLELLAGHVGAAGEGGAAASEGAASGPDGCRRQVEVAAGKAAGAQEHHTTIKNIARGGVGGETAGAQAEAGPSEEACAPICASAGGRQAAAQSAVSDVPRRTCPVLAVAEPAGKGAEGAGQEMTGPAAVAGCPAGEPLGCPRDALGVVGAASASAKARSPSLGAAGCPAGACATRGGAGGEGAEGGRMEKKMGTLVEQLAWAWEEVLDLVKAQDCAPIMLRLAWHDASSFDASSAAGWPLHGGANGSIRLVPELDYQHNKGLAVGLSLLHPLLERLDKVSAADLVQMAAAAAVEASGGPAIPLRYGRQQVSSSDQCCSQGHSGLAARAAPPFPGGAVTAAQHVRHVFARMGLTDSEAVALMGAHTLGRAHRSRSGHGAPHTPYTKDAGGARPRGGSSWTRNWKTFDNSYFCELIAAQRDEHLIRLPTDLALLEDEALRCHVERFAADEAVFFAEYAAAHVRMSEAGALFDPPQGIRLPKP